MKTDVQSFISEHIPEGSYVGKFMGRKGPVAAKHGGMIFWEFEVEIKKDSFTVAGVSSTSFSTDDRCKAHKWAKAIDPNFTDDSESWDDDDAVGNLVQITVEDFVQGDLESSRVVTVEPCPDDPRDPA